MGVATATHTVVVLRRECSDPEMEWLSRVVLDARDAGWYGELVLTYRAGRIVMARRSETIQPPQPE